MALQVSHRFSLKENMQNRAIAEIHLRRLHLAFSDAGGPRSQNANPTMKIDTVLMGASACTRTPERVLRAGAHAVDATPTIIGGRSDSVATNFEGRIDELRNCDTFCCLWRGV